MPSKSGSIEEMMAVCSFLYGEREFTSGLGQSQLCDCFQKVKESWGTIRSFGPECRSIIKRVMFGHHPEFDSPERPSKWRFPAQFDLGLIGHSGKEALLLAVTSTMSAIAQPERHRR
jgi:hypothetical protein